MSYNEKAIAVEQVVLGSILVEPTLFPEVYELLKPECFMTEGHKAIYQEMVDLYSNGEPITAITVGNKDSSDPDKQRFGGKMYLHALINQSPMTSTVIYHAKKVEKYYQTRSVFDLAKQVQIEIQECEYELDDPRALLTKFEELVFASINRDSGYAELRDLTKEQAEHIIELHKVGKSDFGILSDYKALDTILTGFKPSDLIIIAARPGVGKTALALNIALRVPAISAFFTLEMSKQQLTQRAICTTGRIDSHALRSGTMTDQDWHKLSLATAKLATKKMIIDDTPSLNIVELRSKARKFKLKYDVSLIIVDYLQLMSNYKKHASRDREVAEISRGLKLLAKEIEVPVIALSQLSRGVEQREDKRPKLSDLRDSGAIEQDADVVLFIYRPKQEDQMTFIQNPTEIIVAKNRNGKVGTIELEYEPSYTRFNSIIKV